MSMSMSMSMTTTGASMSMTPTSSTAAVSSTAMSGMDMGGMGGDCKISMLWNWYTIDACFLSSSWHITSHGMFAASCIGVAALVVCLEFFRRLGKEYDAYILRQFKRHLNTRVINTRESESEPGYATFRATPLQQLVRSVLHAVVFGLAYLIMLLAMYYNGFILLSIVFGAGIGKFFCDWLVQRLPLTGDGIVTDNKNAVDEPTVCCG